MLWPPARAWSLPCRTLPGEGEAVLVGVQKLLGGRHRLAGGHLIPKGNVGHELLGRPRHGRPDLPALPLVAPLVDPGGDLEVGAPCHPLYSVPGAEGLDLLGGRPVHANRVHELSELVGVHADGELRVNGYLH